MPEINDKIIENLKNIIQDVLTKIDVDGAVFTRIINNSEDQLSFTTSLEDQSELIVFNVKTDDASILIGHNGESLLAFQHLIRILAKNQIDELIPFALDINNYKKEKEEKLEILARATARRVRETGRRIILRPMPAYDRRIMHLYLSREPDLTTMSEGYEPNRKIIVNCQVKA